MLFAVRLPAVSMSQITCNSCHSLIETEDYIFNQKALDITGRNTFETNPVDENSPCGGIGNCEFQIAWNDTSSRWEIYAYDGNVTFTNTYVFYYNTEASLSNLPSLTLGTWMENTEVTQSLFGIINTSTGGVQDMILSVVDVQLENAISLYPNPVNNALHMEYEQSKIDNVSLYCVLGKQVLSINNTNTIDVSKLNGGIYFVALRIGDRVVVKKIVVE